MAIAYLMYVLKIARKEAFLIGISLAEKQKRCSYLEGKMKDVEDKKIKDESTKKADVQISTNSVRVKQRRF